MKNHAKELFVGTIVLIVIAAVLILAINANGPLNLKSMIIGIAISVSLVLYLVNEIRKSRERKANIPVEDEMSRMNKILAGSKSFHASMLLWLLLFIFKRYFNEIETLLGIGILGSALIYGIYLRHYRIKGVK